MLSLDASEQRHSEFARLQRHRRREHRGIGIVRLDGGDAIGLIADLKQSHIDVWPESLALE